MTHTRILLSFTLFLSLSSLATAVERTELRVCADPDNLPFSNDKKEGFENKIAELIADEMHASLEYVWAPQTDSSIGRSLRAGKCDLIMGAPPQWGPLMTTKPYYSSTYVFVYQKQKHWHLNSFDDPVLAKSKIGLPLISDDGATPPAASALARRGLSGNVIGYPIYPPAKIIEAVASGEIDVAIVWGPFAGYFAKQQDVRLVVNKVVAGDDAGSFRFNFDIAMGVKRGDLALKQQLENVLDRRHNEILEILDEYGVPVIPQTGGGSVSAKSIQ